ncbi:MAG: hypothetical protein JSU92_03700 [Deltaproteobacteria bacterium]|nr:MAG: hypothetical protein JSU92_03700 [Deltaproteobacteria bacterium]
MPAIVFIVDINYQRAKSTAEKLNSVHPDWLTIIVDSCFEAKKAAEVFDLNAAIINHELPDGDGLELMIELQEKNPFLAPIILIPTSFSQKLREIVKFCGALDLLEEPLDNGTLVTTVERAIEQCNQRASLQKTEEQRPKIKSAILEG